MIEASEIEEWRRVPWNEDPSSQCAVCAKTDSPFSDREVLAVTRGECGQVACHACHVAIAAEDRIERERPPELGQLLADEWRGRKRDNPVRCRQGSERIGGPVCRYDVEQRSAVGVSDG